MALLTPVEQRGVNTLAVSTVIAALLFLTWLARILYYRCAMHNGRFYQQLVEYEQQLWWQQHRQVIGLHDIVLLGPSGTEPQHWSRLLLREHRSPQPVTESTGRALRLPQIVTKDSGTREAQLASLLVLQWRKQRPDALALPPRLFYWLGSPGAWQAFTQQASVTFPELLLPEQPENWLGEASLATVIEKINNATVDQTILIAGCASQPAISKDLPAGEAAVLWLVGREGVVQLNRGEICDSSTLANACQRALEQSEISEPPDACLLFTLPENELPSLNGWNLTHHVQDANWGITGNMAALILMSLAALNTQQQGKPSAWIARDLTAGYTTGIVKTYG
ncbi:hypothetical protein SAMN06273570_3618 [Candidatus Pantoea floridensis]|uniref:Uncharacterized protein n=1 Tax=Candidatus Pantoea floridensis TaxID=1938870 RepID=A0A286BYH0_9GAMM|nr:hypothetical protein BX596_1065 [Enterobacteriaceae bacterium JKS000233]SOD39177.1 hypothetical protein SAMN06273570_3618 [Pantoea floridensis]